MASSFTATSHELAWRFSSLLQQETKHPYNLTRRSRTGWSSQIHKGLPSSYSDKDFRRSRKLCSRIGVLYSLYWNDSEGVPCYRISAHAGQSRVDFLSQRSVIKGNEKKPRSRVVVQAGRSKPKLPQPIRTPRRKSVKRPSGRQPDPAGNIRKGKSDQQRKPPEPYVRHPDEYYRYGPYGPYSYKAGVVGDLIPVTSLEQDYVFTWSTIKDNKEQEKLDFHDACVLYDQRVETFNPDLLQFFYVFARLPFYVGPEPTWKQWTLVAEITVESGESLDTLSLLFRLTDNVRNRITDYTGWTRPDLVYVKPSRRRYQVRFESEEEFIRQLEIILMESAGEPHERDSYFGEFCQILGVDVNASHEDITTRYEESSEEVQLACVEHLLSKHPVQLLPPMAYPNRGVWMTRKSSGDASPRSKSDASTSAEVNTDAMVGEDASKAMHYYEDEEPSESDEGKDMEQESEDMEAENEEWDDVYDPAADAEMNEGFWKQREVELARSNATAVDEDEAKDFSEDEDDAGEKDAGEQEVSPRRLKAAARPYTYVSLIREMVMLREMILEQKGRMKPLEAGQA